MSEASVIDAHFEEIKNSILSAHAKTEDSNSTDADIVNFSGISYSVTEANDESVTFSALDLDFVIRPDGEISLLELEDGQVHVYELEDGSMKDHLHGFLSWRSQVLSTIGV